MSAFFYCSSLNGEDIQMDELHSSSKFTIVPIGIIRTPHKSTEGIPRQPTFAQGVEGTILIYPQFREALTDLDGFERIWVLFWCHRAKAFKLKIIPYADTTERGLFATRAPSRPNPIGISHLRLKGVDVAKGMLKVSDVDILDGTPIIDIKPYSPEFDCIAKSKSGWLDQVKEAGTKSDSRFEK